MHERLRSLVGRACLATLVVGSAGTVACDGSAERGGGATVDGGGVSPDAGGPGDGADGMDAGDAGYSGPLVADAGPDASVDEGLEVVLVGQSRGHGAREYGWRQLSGPPARDMVVGTTIDDESPLHATMPYLTEDATLVFELVVTAWGGEVVTDTVEVLVRDVPGDQDLEPGFPVQTFEVPGSYQTGAQSLFVAVGNLDADPELEAILTATSGGPLWAWNPDGSPVEGWPEINGRGTGYPSIGNLAGPPSVQEVATGYGPFAASCEPDRFLMTGAGELMPGWPQSSCNAGTTIPPALADIDGDGVDEIFFSHEGFQAGGDRLPGWPQQFPGDPIAVGDIDGDGRPEVVISSYDGYIDARNRNNRSLPGFPAPTDSPGYTVDAVLLGDVNGDGAVEIIRPRKAASNVDYQAYLEVYDNRGRLLWTRRTVGDIDRHTSPALADLDGDGVPEIVVQSNGGVDVWRGNGDPLPGWPVQYAAPGDIYSDAGSSAPAVGDVDGDQLPDVVVAARTSFSSRLYAFSSGGVLLARFPRDIPGCDARAPAIADIDLDGRNEILVGGAAWDGIGGLMDALWVYDLGGPPGGRIEWGQVGGDARHRNVYPVDTTAP